MDSESDPLLRVARAGDLASRLDLADVEHLERAVLEVLANDPAPEVVWLVASNHTTPRDILERLAGESAALRELVELNPNAPAALKEPVALWRHIQTSVERYLDDQGATDSDRQALMSAWLTHDTETLGDAWIRVHGER